QQAADQPLQRTAEHPDELARRATEISRAHVRHRGGLPIEIHLTLAARTAIEVDAAEVITALVNVIVNAIDALRATGGTIIVATPTDDDGALFEITDDGPGIPAKVRERLFDPFFTTKGARGVGIGLAMVEACMRRHGGKIDVDSRPGVTRFRLRFPR